MPEKPRVCLKYGQYSYEHIMTSSAGSKITAHYIAPRFLVRILVIAAAAINITRVVVRDSRLCTVGAKCLFLDLFHLLTFYLLIAGFIVP